MAVEWAEARASADRLLVRIPEAGRLSEDDRADARSRRRLSGIAPIDARCRYRLLANAMESAYSQSEHE